LRSFDEAKARELYAGALGCAVARDGLDGPQVIEPRAYVLYFGCEAGGSSLSSR
jgi:hypothetical protein